MSVYIGLMSGTSLDGISAAAVEFVPDESRSAGSLRPRLLAFTSTPYTVEQRDRLSRAVVAGSAQEYCRLSFDLGHWFADAAELVIDKAGLRRADVTAIGSHGQTIWHETSHSTWQLGEAAVIAERIGVNVVSDFRVRDMAAGGQGAPLVSIADALIFSSEQWRALQNIGGIGNVSVVPPGGRFEGTRAFDTGPGVVVIDSVVRKLVRNAVFDVDGLLAARGRPIATVVDELLTHPYFASRPPKTTGRELFDAEYTARLIDRCCDAEPECRAEDIIATATLLTARSIADAYARFLPEPVTEVLVSGGGAKNPTLMGMLEREIGTIPVRAFDDHFFDGEAKESVAFALLALLCVSGLPGNIPTATGARGARVLGKLTAA